MGIGIVTDKKQQPTEPEIQQALGPRLEDWHTLVHALCQEYPCEAEFKFMYGKNYGWALRFRIGGQLLANLYPADGGFTVQVNLPPKAVEQALGMGLGESALGAINRANPYSEGRWVFIPVQAERDLGDIQHLIRMRVATKRLHN
jgi:hypothetical protein